PPRIKGAPGQKPGAQTAAARSGLHRPRCSSRNLALVARRVELHAGRIFCRWSAATTSLQFDGRSSGLELLLDLGRLVLADACLDGLGRSFDEIFGFFEAEAGDRAHFLDDVDLLLSGSGEDDVELRL